MNAFHTLSSMYLRTMSKSARGAPALSSKLYSLAHAHSAGVRCGNDSTTCDIGLWNTLPGLDGCLVGSVLLNGKGSAGIGPVSSCKIVIAASADLSSETRSVSLSKSEKVVLSSLFFSLPAPGLTHDANASH
jgi:hypothetical protein